MKNEELKNGGLPVSAVSANLRNGAETLELGPDYRDLAWRAAIKKIDDYLSSGHES